MRQRTRRGGRQGRVYNGVGGRRRTGRVSLRVFTQVILPIFSPRRGLDRHVEPRWVRLKNCDGTPLGGALSLRRFCSIVGVAMLAPPLSLSLILL